jgi:sugar lactone lactonase YvrE
VYVADSDSATIRKITPLGVVTTLAGAAGQHGSTDGSGANARFDRPVGVALDVAGNVYVADTGNATLRRITPAGEVSTLAGAAGQRGATDGVGAAARFNHPGGLAVDAAGNVYLADRTRSYPGGWLYLETVANTIRKITPAGVVTTLAGTAGTQGAVDGVGAVTSFNFKGMTGVAVDTAGNVYVVDSGNHTIRKITPTGLVTTLAGRAGTVGSVDGVGAGASFDHPRCLTVDAAGNVYVTSGNVFFGYGNVDWYAYLTSGTTHVETGSTIRKITPAGVVSTVAGQATSEGIALGPLPGSLAYLGGITVDSKGTLYAASQAAVLKVQLPQ